MYFTATRWLIYQIQTTFYSNYQNTAKKLANTEYRHILRPLKVQLTALCFIICFSFENLFVLVLFGSILAAAITQNAHFNRNVFKIFSEIYAYLHNIEKKHVFVKVGKFCPLFSNFPILIFKITLFCWSVLGGVCVRFWIMGILSILLQNTVTTAFLQNYVFLCSVT